MTGEKIKLDVRQLHLLTYKNKTSSLYEMILLVLQRLVDTQYGLPHLLLHGGGNFGAEVAGDKTGNVGT